MGQLWGMRRLEVQLQEELSRILNKEEVMWFQHSRTMWLSDGDRNTMYYHMKTLARRKRNKILMLKDVLEGSCHKFLQNFISFP